MQESQSASHYLLEVLKYLAVPVAGLVGALVSRFFEWGKRKPEISAIEASAQKTRAEARKLDGEALDLAWERIDELIEINFELRKKLDLCEIRSRHHEGQERRMLALMELHGIKYKEFDEPKQMSELDEPK